ncbi:MAG: 2-pyrone-4,6-dicarboxylate hydrolase [Bryobacterales bacterium]|nr:2-pyrone-4,6-dicarboxylate hydrolase [Bryobacterales bacterium]
MIRRREFIQGAMALAALQASAPPVSAQEVPNSVGTNQPKTKAPAQACDCHMHIYDPARFPFSGTTRAPSRATVAQYRLLQKRNGTSRVVIVTPRNYVVDNRVTVDAIAQLGIANARGVAVVHPTITGAELKKLNEGGIRGIRFSIADPAVAVTTPAMIEPLAKRVADLGWHIQFNMSGQQVVELADVLRRLPTQMVFDHLANPPLPAGVDHASHGIVRELLDKRRAWVKLSGAYSNTKVGPPSYPEATAIARDFVQAAPERLVWGSDWPHPSLPDDRKPDDALLFDLLAVWAPNEAVRNRILVRNPETLYGFAKSA